MKKKIDYVEIKIPAKPEFVGVIRLTLSGIASRIGFSYEEIEDIKIAASEACTNAVQHAYKPNEQGEIIVSVGLYKNRIEVIVSDNGKNFNLVNNGKKIGPYSSEESIEFLREGGLGLYLIETLMDEVEIRQGNGVSVYMVKYLDGEQVERNANAQRIST
ncbi:anti-sigma B factor RsbW [Bacillus aquiflavi]|uniref:Serine-protein kinase RsbW n=1 Tax=Bacillus aquiflavi TaxID=2672567 RepID=A0A6B3VY48_9BACI|nr:anti-sigma B factor RsbW [Bacillus aquiflavi]MBA4536828.1 anti-sigma B factor RsbW [Bacillus aquiflavi]NEY81195.1 anti-sigma B factor RsbW [Bacillus aquiflavi]UAC48493.1 anti-sigma B factor RsbW [Bacillus aquiflavi]